MPLRQAGNHLVSGPARVTASQTDMHRQKDAGTNRRDLRQRKRNHGKYCGSDEVIYSLAITSNTLFKRYMVFNILPPVLTDSL